MPAMSVPTATRRGIQTTFVTTLGALALLVGSMVGPASAAGPVTCTVEPIANSESAQGALVDREFRFMAMWMGEAHCDDPTSPLHGATLELRQMARVSPRGEGSVGGPTRFDWDRDVSQATATSSGVVDGSASCNATECMLLLDLRVSGDGFRASGSEALTFTRATGEVQSFTPPVLSFLNIATHELGH